MLYSLKSKKILSILSFSLLLVLCFLSAYFMLINDKDGSFVNCSTDSDFIKYAEFNPTYEALEYCMNVDINAQKSEHQINWIDLLAYYAAKYYGDFSKYENSSISKIADKLKTGISIEKLCEDNNIENFEYYKEVYTAVLAGFLGYKNDNSDEYGLKVYFPIAKSFAYEHYDDFGNMRTYGYTRPHLGHDLIAQTGTPVIAVEDGIVEVMGWNQYGGWRIGIRSYDKKRYYYYAHLRKDKPFQEGLSENQAVKAGDVIGYVGKTGYSLTENTNNIQTSHLHFGMQLIFDESQKECDNEIWINLYHITRLLEKNKSEVYRNSETKYFYKKD
ncbi:MAG: M23 family metallopeptidase [Clostridia bacterium]|nr:M23 family metallopeptidase [Clostridia bacterium]